MFRLTPGRTQAGFDKRRNETKMALPPSQKVRIHNINAEHYEAHR